MDKSATQSASGSHSIQSKRTGSTILNLASGNDEIKSALSGS